MDRLRKVLAAFFAVLCVFFAWKAYDQKREISDVENLEMAGWNSGMTALARKYDRLIIFNVEGVTDGLLASPSPKAEEILNRHYVRVSLRPEYFPADYGAIQRIYNLSGAKGEVGFGILSPKGYPIFVGRDFSFEKDSKLNDATLLAGVALMYKKRSEETKSGIAVALNKAGADIKLPKIPGLFAESKRRAEITNMRSLFLTDSWGGSIAVLTENARLAARLASGGDSLSVQTAELAQKELLENMEMPGLSFSDKLLFARALSEFAFISDSPEVHRAFRKASDAVLKLQGGDGYFATSDQVFLNENALALSVMARAYKVFGDDIFKSALDKSSAALMKKAESHSTLPAVLKNGKDSNPRSESGALDYVLLARAYLDAFFATGDGEQLKSSKKIFSKLDEFFRDEKTESWFENGGNSVFAQFFRYRILGDSRVPSTTGEALQLLADISSIEGGISPRFVKIVSSLNVTVASEAFLDRASIKLSVLANPMRPKSSRAAAVAAAN